MNCPMEHRDETRGRPKADGCLKLFQKPSRCAAAAGAVGHAQALARQQIVVILRKIVGPLPLVASTLVPARCLYPTPTHSDTRNCTTPSPVPFAMSGPGREIRLSKTRTPIGTSHTSRKRDQAKRCPHGMFIIIVYPAHPRCSVFLLCTPGRTRTMKFHVRGVACGDMACTCAWRHHRSVLQC
jgi:hypothetical protein